MRYLDQTVSAPEGETYNVYGYDSWGDGWNGATLDVQVSGVSLGTFTLNGGGSGNSCNGAYSGGALIGSFFVAAPCDITCPDNISVDNDPGVCGANVTVPAAETGDSCEGAFQFANAATGQVPLTSTLQV